MPGLIAHNTFVNLGPPPGLPRVGGSNSLVFESFGILYKHCKEIHLPQSGRNIRLGTLTEYRRNENVAIRDEHEGTFNVSLNFPVPTTITVDALKKATLGTSPLGMGHNIRNVRATSFAGHHTSGSLFSSDDVVVSQRTEEEITLSGQVNLHFEGADAWLFCLSTSDVLESTILDSGYDSIWSIPPGSILDLAKHLASHLKLLVNGGRNFSSETIGPFNAPGFSPPTPGEHMVFEVTAEIWRVKYRNRVIDISSDISEEIIKDVHGCVDKSASIKPESFSHEQEIRLIFRPTVIDRRNGQRFLFPNYLKPVFVPFDPLLSFVDVTS